MSETITKACYDCDGTGRDRSDFTRSECRERDGTGPVPDTEATLRAEVARLTGERDAWRAKWESLNNDVNEYPMCQDCARLTAEVERLKGQNDANRPLAIGDVITLEGEVGMVAWVGSERCRVVWSTEAVTSEPNDTAIAARSAWLAGCKS